MRWNEDFQMIVGQTRHDNSRPLLLFALFHDHFWSVPTVESYQEAQLQYQIQGLRASRESMEKSIDAKTCHRQPSKNLTFGWTGSSRS
jgi:hypothetical protein